MSAKPILLHKPFFKFLPSGPPKLKSIKPRFSSGLFASKSSFLGGFVLKKAVSERNRVWAPRTMVELIKTSAFKGGNGDKGVKVLEHEALVNVSSKLRPEILADGLEATLNRMSKWLVAALFGAVILWRHDAEALWAAMGSVVNVMLSLNLKQILNQERPVSTLRSDPGMPSSHSQSIFYTVTFTILSIMEWLGINEVTVTISVLALAFGSYLAWLRVSQQLHTVSQVAVGAVLGFIVSIFWYWSWYAFVLKAFISSLWVQAIVVLGAAGFGLGFLVHVVRYWLGDEDESSIDRI